MTQHGPHPSTGDDAGSANPFSREGSAPGDALGAERPSPDQPPPPEPTVPFPSYPASAGSSASAGSLPSASEPWPGYPPASSYPAANGYRAADIPAYGSHGSAPAAPPPYEQPPSYGSNPYDHNPYAPAQVNPYQMSPYGSYSPYGVVPQQHPNAVVAMVMGILGLVICPVFAIPGFVLGNKARKAIDAEPYRYAGRGMATAGFVLGIVGLVYLALVVLFVGIGLAGGWD